MADQEDREQQVAQFVEMTGATPEQVCSIYAFSTFLF